MRKPHTRRRTDLKAAEGELTSLGIMQPYIHGEVCSPDWPYCLQDAAEQTMQSCLTGVVVVCRSGIMEAYQHMKLGRVRCS